MPSILSRFKKSPSSSSSLLADSDPDPTARPSEVEDESYQSFSSSYSTSGSPVVTNNRSTPRSGSGSVFIEQLGEDNKNQNLSPVKRNSNSAITPGAGIGTPSNPNINSNHSPFVIPDSTTKPSTPRLVFTAEGSSPRSFSDNSPSTNGYNSPSAHINRSPNSDGLIGLGLGTNSPERYKPTKMNGDSNHVRYGTAPASLAQPLPLQSPNISTANSVALTESPNQNFTTSSSSPNKQDKRNRSGSVLSAASAGSEDAPPSRRPSVAVRVAEKLHGNTLSLPPDGRSGNGSTNKEKDKDSKSKKSKKNRRGSQGSSTLGHGQGGIAGALAKSGLQLAGGIAHPDDIQTANSFNSTSTEKNGTRHGRANSVSKGRSPFLTRGGKVDEDDASYLRGDGDDEASARREVVYDLDDDDEEDDDEDEDSDERSLPVTGFAVASNRRNADFHSLFPTVDEGDYLIEDYGCALSKDILVQGRLYVSENHLCFHANIFGWVTDVVIPFSEIKTIEKKMTALVIPNAIGVVTNDAKYTLASFISRDATYDVMMNIWRLSHPNAVMSSYSLASRPASIAGEEPPNTASTRSTSGTTKNGGTATTNGGGGSGGGFGTGTRKASGKGHKATTCQCGKDGKHYNEIALEATFPSTPEKVYNLMFNSGWYKTFLSENQKLRDVEQSDWRPSTGDTKILTKSTSYIKPLNGSIGPKQTKCHIIDEQEHVDFDNYISMLTTTKTPDVPSGGVFSVKTRTCFMWAGGYSTKVVVTTTVEWTGKSWVKGIIEKSCIDGQKTYHDDLASGMRAYMKEHHSEFAGEGGDEADDEAVDGDAALLKTTSKSDEKEKQTEAEAYAAKARRERQEQDLTSLQGSIDTVVTGVKAIGSGLKIVFDALSDLFADTLISKELVMGLVILLLVLSNIYTYFKVGGDADLKSAKKLGRTARRLRSSFVFEDGKGESEAEGEMAEAVRLLLQAQLGGGGGGGGRYGRDSGADTVGGSGSSIEEAKELRRIVADVERRLDHLKTSLVEDVVDPFDQSDRGLDDHSSTS